jgi:hypothetical protein
MNESEITTYTEVQLRQLRAAAKYPCDTDRMTYDVYLHRYTVKQSALLAFGVNVETDYETSAPDKWSMFINEISEDLYGAMGHIAPFNFQYNSMLVAQSLCIKYPDKYTARQRFEQALLYQGKYKIENIDVRDINGVDVEAGQNLYFKVLRKEGRHISPRALDILQELGLFFNGSIPQKVLINYERLM